MGNQVIRGWRNAAARSGCSAATLRALWEAGRLTTSQDESGVNLFDADALDAVREARAAKANAAATASADNEAAATPPPAPTGALPDFLARAVASRDAAGDDGDQPDVAVEAEADEVGNDNEAAPRPFLPPLGASRSSSPWSGFPHAAAAVQAAEAAQAHRVAELEREVAALRADRASQTVVIDAANAEAARWRSLFRAMRLQNIGDQVATELEQQRARYEVTQEAAQAAVAAAAALPDEALAHPGALGVARQAAAWIVGRHEAMGSAYEQSDLDRARDRRVMRRHRGRW